MNKNEFLEKLSKKLHDNRINDVEEIISEYEEHFAFKLADGYSEEEIAAKLGKPEALADQFVPSKDENKSGGKKAITITGLVFADIFVGAFFILLFAWVIVMGAFTIASAATGVCFIFGLNIYSLFPIMPYGCGVVFAIALLALCVLSAVGTIYCEAFACQLLRAYGRFHNNCICSASDKAVLPSLSTHPLLLAKTRRILRNIALISLTVFLISAMGAYVISALTAGALEFWHKWNWFVK